jgi:hypothetical protein
MYVHSTIVVRTYSIYLINQSPYIRTIYLHSNIRTGSGSGSGSGQFKGHFPSYPSRPIFLVGSSPLPVAGRPSPVALHRCLSGRRCSIAASQVAPCRRPPAVSASPSRLAVAASPSLPRRRRHLAVALTDGGGNELPWQGEGGVVRMSAIR